MQRHNASAPVPPDATPAFPATWTLPTIGRGSLTVAERARNPNGTIGARLTLRDGDGALVRTARVVARHGDPLLLLGGAVLGGDTHAETLVVRLLLDPARYDRVLAEATDPGPPVPPPVVLPPSAEVMLRMIERAREAGWREGRDAGYLAGYAAGKAGAGSGPPAPAAPPAPTRPGPFSFKRRGG